MNPYQSLRQGDDYRTCLDINRLCTMLHFVLNWLQELQAPEAEETSAPGGKNPTAPVL